MKDDDTLPPRDGEGDLITSAVIHDGDIPIIVQIGEEKIAMSEPDALALAGKIIGACECKRRLYNDRN